MKTDRLYYLLEGYKKNSLNAEEQQELTRAIADTSNAEALKGWLADSWGKETLPDLLSKEQSQSLYESIRENLKPAEENLKPNKNQFPRYRSGRISRIAAAASIVIALSALSYLWFANHKQSRVDEFTKTIAQSQDIKAPDATKARITLADGSTLYLDSLDKGESASQQGAEIVKLEKGELQYKGTGTAKEVTFNTLVNPRGSDVVIITLADGTRIWLNAESSITYPTSFIKGERKIELTGEAYLEVARNEKMPFIVNVRNKAEVKVLGTEFNIKAYDDEPEIKTTLVRGEVQVARIARNDSVKVLQYYRLKPGEQASLNKEGILSVGQVDIKEHIVWKNNMFCFNDTDLESIMKNLSRWYDVDVSYENPGLKSLTFGALISRRSNISAILNLMIMTGTVNFEISNGRIVVKDTPKDGPKYGQGEMI